MSFKNIPKEKKDDFRKKIESKAKRVARKPSKRGFASIPAS